MITLLSLQRHCVGKTRDEEMQKEPAFSPKDGGFCRTGKVDELQQFERLIRAICRYVCVCMCPERDPGDNFPSVR